jgi:hypothetical protein
MTTRRGSSNLYEVGNRPPTVTWTIVRGDTAAFKVYATDDVKQPLTISDFSILMEFKRPNYQITNRTIGTITDDAEPIFTLTPEQDEDDGPGEFTVSLSSDESEILQTGDIFDIELRSDQNQIVWTVAQGYIIQIEDVTN